MGKSKYASRAQAKINEDPSGRFRPKYYDEKIKVNKDRVKITAGLYAIIFAGIILSASVIIGVTFFGTDDPANPDDPGDNGGNDPIDPTIVWIAVGDDFTATYTLWIADVAGDGGVVDPADEPYQTSETPIEFNTEGVIPGFKAQVLGMSVGQDKIFELAPGEGYVSGDLAYFRLVFYVKIYTIN